MTRTSCPLLLNRAPHPCNLVLEASLTHTELMATTAKKKTRARRSAPAEKAFVYRGIKIPPANGRRSPLAQAILDDLRKMSERSRGEPAQA